MSVVKHRILDEIALIEISNPPVNAISAAVRIGLLETIENLSLNEKIKAIVITAPERTFLAGADNRYRPSRNSVEFYPPIRRMSASRISSMSIANGPIPFCHFFQ